MLRTFALLCLIASLSAQTTTPPACPSPNKLYTVVNGDTCANLAITFGSDLTALTNLNPSCGTTLQIGQVLCIPIVITTTTTKAPTTLTTITTKASITTTSASTTSSTTSSTTKAAITTTPAASVISSAVTTSPSTAAVVTTAKTTAATTKIRTTTTTTVVPTTAAVVNAVTNPSVTQIAPTPNNADINATLIDTPTLIGVVVGINVLIGLGLYIRYRHAKAIDTSRV